MTTEKLKELERINDKALVAYWKAVIVAEECDAAVQATREYLALHVARMERDKAQDAMAKARFDYLSAKVAVEGD